MRALTSETFQGTALDKLEGVRRACHDEANEGKFTNMLKEITGSSILDGRKVHGREVKEYRITISTIITCNDIPEITSVKGFGDRINIITFDYKFPKKDEDYRRRVLNDIELRTKVFRWLVKGYVRHHKKPTKMPPSWANATKRYLSDSDVIGEFITEQIKYQKGSTVSTGDMRQAFKEHLLRCNKLTSLSDNVNNNDIRN